MNGVSEPHDGGPWAEAILVLRRNLVEQLAPHGISVDDVITLAAPIQVIGRLPSGERYYFRSRHGTASLDVWDRELEFEGPAQPDPADLIWSDEIEEWSDSEASYLSERGTADLILTFAKRFASRRIES